MTATDTPGTELAPYAGGQLEQYQARLAMTPEAAKALDDQLRACTRAVLREGTDYGVIPGTGGDKTLLKPGAEKLLQWFGFGFTCDRVELDVDDDGRKQGVTYRCVVTKQLPDRTLVAVTTCEGYAGYDEDRFYQSAEQAQFKAEAKERMWAAKDRRPANPNKWKFLTEYRAPWNTVIKMAQKRAIVGATIDATAAAGLFSQEEDDSPPADDGTTWYEQALETALTFTTTEAGQQLIVDAAHAARDGLCTPGQATHIKNRTRQRLQLLQTATPVHVEDLGQTRAGGGKGEDGQGGEDRGMGADRAEPSGSQRTDPPRPDASGPADDQHRKLVGAVQGHFKRLGFTDDDRADRLWAAAKLAGTSEITSLNDLDPDELAAVADTLAKCRDRKRLEELLAAAGEGGGDG